MRLSKQEFLNKVCGQVRWKHAHDSIRGELNAHIEDQAEALEREGRSSGEAEAMAVEQMGDPSDVGMRLDASYRPKPVLGMLIPFGILLLLGVMSRVLIYDMGADEWARFALAAAIGGACFMLLYNVNLYRFVSWSKYAYLALAAAIVIGALALGLGVWINGLNSLICHAVLLIPLYAGMVYAMRGRGIWGLLLCDVSICAPLLLITTLPALSIVFGAVISGLGVLTYAIFSGVFGKRRLAPLATVYAPTVLTAAYVVLSQPYRLERLRVLFDPMSAADGAGYMAARIRLALEGAKLIGHGSEVEQIFRSLNFAADYILTSIIYNFGWLPAALIAAALLVFLVMGFKKALRLDSLFGRMLGFAIMTTFAVQTGAYVAANLGLVFAQTLPLPFVAYGNTALVLDMALAGLLLSLFRMDGLYADKPAKKALRLRLRVEIEK